MIPARRTLARRRRSRHGNAPTIRATTRSCAGTTPRKETAFTPQAEGVNFRLNGIANFPTPESTSSICDDFNIAAWHIAIDDSVNILWQKKYNHGRSSATLTPILFPNPDTVITGGQAIVPGDPLRALLVQSQTAIGSPSSFVCGEETNAVFERVDLSSEAIKSPFKDLSMTATPWIRRSGAEDRGG
ncbi:MAG: hypothetical protein ACRD3J_01245 [Thermoanaerobaculia bacterium]